MKNIAQHIEELIISHDCVIVPELGGFITYQEGSHNRNNKLYAPQSQIRYNSLLKYQDGLLAEAYMKDRNISYNEALNEIGNDVKKIKEAINQNRPYILGRIGSLSLKGNGNIEMRCGNANFLPNNIGLPIVRLNKLSITENHPIESQYTITLPKPNSNILRYAAMIAIVVIISVITPSTTNQTTHRAAIGFDSLRNVVMPTIINNNLIEDINSTTTLTEKNEKKSETSTSLQEATPTNNNRYHLIIASLTSRAQAEQYINEQTNFSTETLEILECEGKYRISAYNFSTYQQAIDYSDSIRDNFTAAKRAWILYK